METEKRYMLILHKPHTINTYMGCETSTFGGYFSIQHDLTEEEAYAAVLKYESNSDPKDDSVDYFLFNEPLIQVSVPNWDGRLREEVSKVFAAKKQLADKEERLRKEAARRRSYEELRAEFENSAREE